MYPFPRPHSIVLTLTAVLFLVGCKSTEIQSTWTDRAMQIDGSSNDWQNLPLTFFEEERLSIGIANDSSNAYIMLRTDNPALMGSIRRSGIMLWLDADGGKDKERGIQYIGGPSPNELEEAGLRMRPDGVERRNMRMPMNMMPGDSVPESRFAYIDRSKGYDDVIFLRERHGPEIAYGLENGQCIYELRIPFTAKEAGIYGMAAGPGQPVEIGAEWKGVVMGNIPRGGGMPGGGPPPGGDRDGGMIRIGGGMKNGPRDAPGEEKEIWIKTYLADSE